jgi:adenylate cyclase
MTAGTGCRTCGIELLAGARFCHGCGSPVAESQTHAEYKQVTGLFADVVQSMDIAAVGRGDAMTKVRFAEPPRDGRARTVGSAV